MWDTVDGVEDPGGGCFEDRAGMSGALAWILDGASPVSHERVTDAPSDARWLVDHLDAGLREVAGDPDPLEKVVCRAIERTAARARKDWAATPEVPPSAALGVVRGTGETCEFLVLADVSVILRTDAGVFEFSDQRVDRQAVDVLQDMEEMLQEGRSFADVGVRTRQRLAEHRRLHMNRTGGYWVASIHENAVGHALRGVLHGVSEVVLASDGFMRALHVFRLVPNAEALFAPDCDFHKLAKQIRSVEGEDPDTRRYPRWSVSDDICALRLRWVG